jgi:CHAT domain-containing protein
MGSIGALAGVTAAAGLSWPEARLLAARHALMASRSLAQPLPSQAQPPDDAVASTNASDADVRALIDAGRYVDAEKLGLARVSALDAARGARHESDATASDAESADTLDLVLLARHLGRRLTQPDTVALAERALRIREAAAGADAPRLASTLVLAGLARAAHRQPEEARRAAARALAMRERSLGPDHVDVANALNATAWIERISGRYEDAKDAATRALAIARRAERPAGRETAISLSILAYAAHGVGDIDTAVPLFEEGVGIEERFYGASHPAFLYSLLQLGNVYWDAGDLERSRDARERAVRGLERIPGSEYRLAFELMLHSNWMNRIGDYAASLAVAERAAAFAERAAGPRSALAAAALDQVAITHGLLGNYAAAIAINQKAVALWSESQGPDSQHAATAWRTLAISYEDAGRIDEALEAIEHALANPAFAKEPIRASEAMLVKASLLVTRGRLDEARTVLSGFRRVNEQIAYFLGRVDLANAFTLQGRVERQQGQPARAVTFYRDALRLTEQNLGPTHPVTAVKRTELAGVLAEAGEVGEARGLLSAGERASLDHLRLLARALPDQAALTFAATRTSGLNLAVTLAAAAPGGVADIDGAFELLIRGRTVILDEMAARHQTALQGGGDAALRERLMTLNRARTRLANLIVRGPEQQPIDRYQALVDRTRETRDRAERDLAEASAAFRQELRRTRAGATEVLAHLPAGAALVSYARYTPQPIAGGSHRTAPRAQTTSPQAYAAFVARPGRRVAIVPLGEASRIDAAIDAWRARIRDELTSAGLASRRTEAAYREAGRALRALVWDPVQSRLGNASTVFIVPDGALHLVDLSTLPAGETGYLADAPVVLHYMLAERDLLQSSSPAASDSLLALGAPDFDKAERSTAAPTPRIASNGASPASHVASAGGSPLRGAAACEASLASRFDPLPATDVEVRHIADLWRRRLPDEVVLLDGARASETAVKALARGRRVLHLATHGFFLDRNCAAAGTRGGGSANQRMLEESPLLRSGLVLAGANSRTRAHAEADANDDDGILTAEEIAGLDLSGAQWAVLSACDTGRGDWQAGEGVVGLRRSFQMAGARTVILSLWPVLDSVTARWMTALYRSKWTSHRTTAAAVRDANRALLAERRANGESTHPLYWSGFIATGDWR